MNPFSVELAKFKEEIFLVQNDIKSAYYERAIAAFRNTMYANSLLIKAEKL